MISHRSYQVEETKHRYSDLKFYSDQLIHDFKEFSSFSAFLDDSWTFDAINKGTYNLPAPKESLYSMSYH